MDRQLREKFGTYAYHFFQTDYQGNVRAVLSESGALEEANSYYPYGMLMPGDDGELPALQPYKYSGKEYVTIHGLNQYDFGPRPLYSPGGIFTTPDPHCENTPGVSQYIALGANPINIIDPTGCDTVFVNRLGYVTNIIKDDSNDTFAYEKQDGSYGYVVCPYGTIEETIMDDDKDYDYDGFKIRGDEYSKAVYEALADNSYVEWGQAYLGRKETGPSYIITGHIVNKEPGIPFLIKKKLKFGYSVRTLIHSHPRKTGPSDPDNEFASDANHFLKNKPQYFVYIPKPNDKSKSKYIEYAK